MALLTCPDCSREVSDKAAACPQCGCPIERAPGASAESPPVPDRQAPAPPDVPRGGLLLPVPPLELARLSRPDQRELLQRLKRQALWSLGLLCGTALFVALILTRDLRSPVGWLGAALVLVWAVSLVYRFMGLRQMEQFIESTDRGIR